MSNVKVYLDNCCYNRPFDDQTQANVVIETLAKLYIQELVLQHELDLVWSYILKFENSRNSFESKKAAIAKWEALSVQFVEKSDMIVAAAKQIETAGIKPADSLHIACAISVQCDYFITVDRGILKYHDDRIVICSPVEFINREAADDQ
jgi:predicted nucleic acid-binding protein